MSVINIKIINEYLNKINSKIPLRNEFVKGFYQLITTNYACGGIDVLFFVITRSLNSTLLVLKVSFVSEVLTSALCPENVKQKIASNRVIFRVFIIIDLELNI